jgi:hypothetical protein
MRKLWHYTVGAYMESIVSDGEIRVADGHVAKGVRPVVWLSYNQLWEETANKLWIDSDGALVKLDREATHLVGGGLYRIEVDPAAAPLDWHAYKRDRRRH